MTTKILSEVHQRHLAALLDQPAVIDAEGLRIGSQYVMFFAEADLMREHVARLTEGFSRPDVLEVGLGLGVFAAQLSKREVGSYTAIEPHPGVALAARTRLVEAFDAPMRVYIDPWQLVTLPIEAFDAIMYDTWPPDGHADPDFAEFVANVAIPCLRPGGRFSFFHSGTAISPARRAVLDRHFTEWTTHPHTMPAEQTPPHWTKPSRDFLIPIATKGRTR
ncbi:class I SAM-dependent methyltransferase [Micromonospora carbonacea]|uniref:Class I SAM-dependent methyltransferase n=1 Tax=Micromonospora carbonacea TaxID=47853 RepID=A0A7H8XDW7_9ACTN|nr:class I SAM-dependent methyltransferase [Micromonospora carbonacea]MBB5829535.1 spermidine synthase [Micromonospora carbonacea]QLD23055.1 class I SAM-dependent methyltransferase [Micromonospora carbonacea]